MLTIVGSAANAQDLITSRGFLSDPSGDLTIQSVAQQTFEPMDRVLARGYTAEVTWIKLTVRATLQPTMLRVKPTYLDRVALFWRDDSAPDGWAKLQNGDTVSLRDRPLPYVSLVFPLDLANASTYYLRLQTTSTSLLGAQALTPLELQRSELFDQGLQTAYYAVMLWMLLWAITDFMIYRQKVVAAFIGMQVVQILYNFSVSGYWSLLFPSATFGDRWLSTFVILVVPVSLLFHRTLFKPFKPSAVALKMLDVLIVVGLGLLAWTFVGDLQTALFLNAFILLCLPILFLWLAFTASRAALLSINALRTLYVLLSLLIVTALTPILGLFGSIEMYIGATTLQGLIGACLMAIFLFLRSKRLQQNSLKARLALARSDQQLLEQESRFEEQTRFMDMLTHELKTPVSVIRITSDMLSMPDTQRERLNRSVYTISAVIDRCRLSIQAEHQKMSPRIHVVDLMQCLADVCLSNLEPKRVELHGTVSRQWQTDEQLLKVILHNLIDNSLKYSPMGSKVEIVVEEIVGTESLQSVVEFVVSNELNANVKPNPEKIFDKYFRSSGSSGHSGSGLGLYLSREIATLLGATLGCKVGDERIYFVLRLPQHKPTITITNDALEARVRFVP